MTPENEEEHFLQMARLLLPDHLMAALEGVEIEAVNKGATARIAWRELKDATRWRQGWI